MKLRVPPETQTGKMFRLRGKGVKPVRGGTVGDLMCRVVVETPVNLSKRQKESSARVAVLARRVLGQALPAQELVVRGREELLR